LNGFRDCCDETRRRPPKFRNSHRSVFQRRINRNSPFPSHRCSICQQQQVVSTKQTNKQTNKQTKQTTIMVFFSCDGCGDMLKKNQVNAHVYRCKNGCHAVSCVDCSVSFYGGKYWDKQSTSSTNKVHRNKLKYSFISVSRHTLSIQSLP
jgi:predicted metal-binding protein